MKNLFKIKNNKIKKIKRKKIITRIIRRIGKGVRVIGRVRVRVRWIRRVIRWGKIKFRWIGKLIYWVTRRRGEVRVASLRQIYNYMN